MSKVVVTLRVMNEFGDFESAPFVLDEEAAETLYNNIEKKTLTELSFPLQGGGNIRLPEAWLNKSIVAMITKPVEYKTPDKPPAPPDPAHSHKT